MSLVKGLFFCSISPIEAVKNGFFAILKLSHLPFVRCSLFIMFTKNETIYFQKIISWWRAWNVNYDIDYVRIDTISRSHLFDAHFHPTATKGRIFLQLIANISVFISSDVIGIILHVINVSNNWAISYFYKFVPTVKNWSIDDPLSTTTFKPETLGMSSNESIIGFKFGATM